MRTRSRTAFLTAAAAGLATAAVPRAARAQGVKLRMAGVFADPFGLPFYAKDSGAFTRAGFDVEATAIVTAGAVAAAIGRGALAIGLGHPSAAVHAINSGVPIPTVAGGAIPGEPQGESHILAALASGPIHGPKTYRQNDRVPTLVGLTTASLRAWLPQNGVPLDQVKLVEFPQTAVVAGLQRGTIDVALLSEPFITPNKSEVRDVGHPLDGIAKEFMVTMWYASKPFMEADRERARKIVAAMYETNRWANTHHAETMAILVRDGKLDGDKLKGMMRSVYATTLTPGQLQPVFNVATANKIFDRPIDANTIITRF